HDDDEEHGPADELDDDGDDPLRVEHMVHHEVRAGQHHEADQHAHREHTAMIVGAGELIGEGGDQESEEGHGPDQSGGDRHQDRDQHQGVDGLATMVDADVDAHVAAQADHGELAGVDPHQDAGHQAQRDRVRQVLHTRVGDRAEQAGGEHVELAGGEQALHESGDRAQAASDDDADQQHHLHVGV